MTWPYGRGAGEACSVIALLAPGQGAQTPGMLAPWLVDDGSRAAVARWSDLTGLDLERLGTTADAEERPTESRRRFCGSAFSSPTARRPRTPAAFTTTITRPPDR